MKNKYLRMGLLSALAISCTMAEVDAPEEKGLLLQEGKTYYAAIDDQPDRDATKTYIDAAHKVLWNEDDRVTIFPGSPDAVEARFTGGEGDTGGNFKTLDYVGATDVFDGREYAVYPHRTDTEISDSEVISYTFPPLQTYRENSFGRGDNPMVAKTTDGIFRFKNAGGYLVFKLYGAGVTVSSVILEGNGGEALAGPSSIDLSGGLPVVTMDGEHATNEIRLYCDKVELPSEGYQEFWFVLPPVEFKKASGGFTITVKTTDGGTFSRSAAMDLSIVRNRIEYMAPLEVIPTPASSTPGIRSLSSTRSSVKYTATTDEPDCDYMITIPTVTDFSALPLDFSLNSGCTMMVEGKPIASGACVDVSKPLSLVVCLGEAEKTYTLKARNTGLPVVRITTEGFGLAELESYKNSLQSTDKTDQRIWLPDDKDPSQSDWSATVRIENPDGTPGMGDDSVYEVATQIKGRGNYTWKWEKKPYALKLKSDEKVLGMPAHKRWVLLANWRDRTLLRNDAALWLSREAGMDYTVRGQFVELEFNGEHRGNYYLCEQIKIGPDRVNISKVKDGGFADLSGGYLMEIDSYWDELNKFKSSEFNLKYMFKEPDDDPDTNPQYAPAYAWMQNYIGEFERVLKSKSGIENHLYENYLDVDSAIWFMLLNELTGNRDFFQNGGDEVFGPHSTYIHKDKGGKLIMGPIWDFDYETFIPASYYGNSWGGSSSFTWRGFDKTGYYYYWLCHDPQFVQRIKELWNGKKDVLKGLTAYIDQMHNKILLSQQFDESIWPGYTQTNRNDNHDYNLAFPNAIVRMKDSFNDKFLWMDNKINSLRTTNPTFKYQ